MSSPAPILALILSFAAVAAPRAAQAGPATTRQIVEDVRSAPRPLDYTAWTLRPGELNIGPTEVDAGLMRGLTLGTDPLMDALGVANARVRVALRERQEGAVALLGSLHSLQLGDMQARQARVGLRGSVEAGPLTLHAGAQASWISAQGSPDLTHASPLVASLFGAEALSRAQEQVDDLALELEGEVRSLALRGAAQLHLGGAHSLVLQAGDTVARSARLNDDLSALTAVAPASLGLSELLSDEHGQGTWGALGWQASWKTLQLRLGLGISDIPYAWLSPTTELAIRLGGRKDRRGAAPAPTARADRPTEQPEQAEQAGQTGASAAPRRG